MFCIIFNCLYVDAMNVWRKVAQIAVNVVLPYINFLSNYWTDDIKNLTVMLEITNLSPRFNHIQFYKKNFPLVLMPSNRRASKPVTNKKGFQKIFPWLENKNVLTQTSLWGTSNLVVVICCCLSYSIPYTIFFFW